MLRTGDIRSGSPSDVLSRESSASLITAGKLEKAIRNHVATKLVRSHSGDLLTAEPGLGSFAPYMLDNETLDGLVVLLLDADREPFDRLFFQAPFQRETAFTLYATVIGPLARRLGELWEMDAITFVDVTLGTARLQSIVDLVRGESTSEVRIEKNAPRLLLVTLENSDHTLGHTMVSACFELAGWTVETLHVPPGEEIGILDAAQSRDFIGFCAGCSPHLASCGTMIDAIRNDRHTRGVTIGIGGPDALAQSDAYREIGADFVAEDVFDGFARASEAVI